MVQIYQNFKAMPSFHSLVLGACFFLSARCLEGRTVSWSSDFSGDKDFQRMILINDGKQLIISGLNGVYNLNTSNFRLLNRDITGPYNSTTNDVIRIMIYNDTDISGDISVTTCSSTRDYCDIRKSSDILISAHHLIPPIKIDGAVAIMTTYLKNTGNSRVENFLFVGCPHFKDQKVFEGRCSKPGIAWYSESGSVKSYPWYGFKSYKDTPVWTEKYIDAFIVSNFRLFFSVQRIRKSNKMLSRVAQVCQFFKHYRYTTPYTYADMPVRCGELTVIKAVKQTVYKDKILFITVFSDVEKSAVCVFSMEDIKKMFAENIKDCYQGIRVSESEDYINLWRDFSKPQPRVPDNETLNQPEYFLCNKDSLPAYQQVIGTRVLQSQPAVQYNITLTAVTVAVKDLRIIAFLGTNNGEILKAVVYPVALAVHVMQPRPHSENEIYGLIDDRDIKKDMYTSHDKKHIFALTQEQVIKKPVESCSEFLACEDCLGSNDPYCGWCFLNNRCGTNDNCTQMEWIPAFGDGKCPHVVGISPDVMSDIEVVSLEIEVSHGLLDVDVTCRFQRTEGVKATISDNGRHVICRPREIQDIVDNTKGYMVVQVSILTNVSEAPIMSSNFTIYSCIKFYSCKSCTSRNWTCKWCLYSNKCIYYNALCNTSNEAVGYGKCPKVTQYTMGLDDASMTDANGTVYLSKDQTYAINITGVNLPTPREGIISYKCKIDGPGTAALLFDCPHFDARGSFTCLIKKEKISKLIESSRELSLQVIWGSSHVDGDPWPVIIYNCEKLVQPSWNCGRCKSFSIYQQYFHCKWCEDRCIYTGNTCRSTSLDCGTPTITRVYPVSAHIKATTLIAIEGYNLGSVFNDTINAVTIAGIQCTSVENGYDPGIKIECELSPSYKVMDGNVNVTLASNASVQYSELFHFQNPMVTSIKPNFGPLSGGTTVAIYGNFLDTGRRKIVKIGGKSCSLLDKDKSKINNDLEDRKLPVMLVCKTSAFGAAVPSEKVEVNFDGADVIIEENVTYKFVEDPKITAINPKKSFVSGGRKLTVVGENFSAIQQPLIYAVIGNRRTKSEACSKSKDNEIYCPSPSYRTATTTRRKSSLSRPKLGFEMDGVSSVSSDSLSDEIAAVMYFPDPKIENFTEVQIYTKVLIIKGQRLKVAANENDVLIKIGCKPCNVTSMTNETIICEPPMTKPECNTTADQPLIVQVHIGYLQRNIGKLEYDASKHDAHGGVIKDEYIIAGSVVGALVLLLVAASIVAAVMCKKRQHIKKEKAGLVYKMDKLEAKFRNQCREEFAALQTAVSDLTSDLEGGNVVFRDYDVYACKTLFTSRKQDSLMSPPKIATEQLQQAMETFKGLLRNRQFLLMLIRTLEKQNSFTVHDKSKVATILMVLNHDNMEYITGILKSLLNELIDKNMASGTPKLLLRRSECVGEKLLTHWLSICLYHFLKDHSGSALYILYKAIKIQTEKGPIDYISNCGKYTLSEDKLITSADKEINSVTLTLVVQHFDYIDNKEKQISVQVLDCDTITQAKNKMLEILYKNVPYSQRPAVHSTSLEIDEGDGASKRLLSDEDASSMKEGIWKRINTLQHYNIQDGSKVYLFLDREMEASCHSLAGASPDSYIVGSFRRSKPIVRTISGSNFWHLTKKHQTDDEVQLSSDLFLPRLLNTKGTLQTYIDDLFSAVLSVGEEPPLIIKYLFDFLDGAAERYGIVDPDVLHTWKCNSLLLRFWVNIIKNPEFVFDIQKPHIVDSCLSVIAQTLMDSCSTADLVLGPDSPSNKLLFAKDIPRYKTMVRNYFQEMKKKPAVSDQDLNSYLTQKVSEKFSGKFYQSTALTEMYEIIARYRNKICNEMVNKEAYSPDSFSPLAPKLEYVFMCMDMQTK